MSLRALIFLYSAKRSKRRSFRVWLLYCNCKLPREALNLSIDFSEDFYAKFFSYLITKEEEHSFEGPKNKI